MMWQIAAFKYMFNWYLQFYGTFQHCDIKCAGHLPLMPWRQDPLLVCFCDKISDDFLTQSLDLIYWFTITVGRVQLSSLDSGKCSNRVLDIMMTSSNGNIFRATGPLCGEFTGTGEFPAQRPVTRSFDVFFDLRPNKRLSKQPWGWWFETPSWSLWRQRNVMRTITACTNLSIWWRAVVRQHTMLTFTIIYFINAEL